MIESCRADILSHIGKVFFSSEAQSAYISDNTVENLTDSGLKEHDDITGDTSFQGQDHIYGPGKPGGGSYRHRIVFGNLSA
ncbi:protein of unknown function [Pseudodesulfovibrio piezophilus C1TLV30]|uniref:Uncharacterized protein n=1 Tax=Pseudodesulfovibrio piezophilus (strain DSM 21447 / JCM 15486 / C1TLV30) TaxID=1322246 RepID=M1WMY0_PSEP2|nr:protein of unknown function [Pseudodesulfovibrio piezophilus C1TLV30]